MAPDTDRAGGAGGPGSGELKIAIGRLHRPHGLHGEIKFQPFFDPAAFERFIGARVTLTSVDNESSFDMRLVSVRAGGKQMIARFEGVGSPEEARRLTRCVVRAPLSSMPPLPEGEYYYEQIVGLPVFDRAGGRIGTLTGFFPAGEKDVWEIRTEDGGELLTPCIPDVVKEVDLEAGRIVIEPMDIEEE